MPTRAIWPRRRSTRRRRKGGDRLRLHLRHTPAPAEHRRARLDGLPVEEVMIVGPGMDLGFADAAVETAGVLFGMLLLCRAVAHPAARAGKLFDRP